MTQRAARDQVLRIALYSGVYVRQDAISHSIRHKVEVLRRASDAGHPVEWRVFAHGTDADSDPRVRAVPSVAELVADPFFWAADVHVFEFGIHYPLFDAVFLVPADRAVLGIYHNVTPLALVTDKATEDAVVQAERQRLNLTRATHIANDSEFNLQGLVELGFPPERLSVLHLPPSLRIAAPPAARRRRPGPLRLLYVGRLVSSKGVLDLIAAVSDLLAAGHELSLTLVGNIAMSDPVVLAEIQAQLAAGLARNLSIRGNLDDAGLAALYQDVDALVMPSYHEGYCVPVVEALAFGCFVVAYDAANLPNVVGEVGALVPAGDVDTLRSTLAVLAQRVEVSEQDGTEVLLPTLVGDVPRSRWLDRVCEHNARHDRAQYDRGFMRLLHTCASSTPSGSPDWLADHVALALPGPS